MILNFPAVAEYAIIAVIYVLILSLITYQVKVIGGEESFTTYIYAADDQYVKYFPHKPTAEKKPADHKFTYDTFPENKEERTKTSKTRMQSAYSCLSNRHVVKYFPFFETVTKPVPDDDTNNIDDNNNEIDGGDTNDGDDGINDNNNDGNDGINDNNNNNNNDDDGTTITNKPFVKFNIPVTIEGLYLGSGKYCVSSYAPGVKVMNDAFAPSCSSNRWVLVPSVYDKKGGDRVTFSTSVVNILSPDRSVAWARDSATGYIVLKNYDRNDPGKVFAVSFLRKYGPGRTPSTKDGKPIPHPQVIDESDDKKHPDDTTLKMRFRKPQGWELDVVPTKYGSAWTDGEQQKWSDDEQKIYDVNKSRGHLYATRVNMVA